MYHEHRKFSSFSELAEDVVVEFWPPSVVNVTFTTSAAHMNTPTKLDVAITYDSHGSQRHNQYIFPIAQKIG